MENFQPIYTNENVASDKLLSDAKEVVTDNNLSDASNQPPTPTVQTAPANNAASTNQTAADGNTTAVPVLYDATAKQRFPFQIKEDGELIETAHIFKPVDDAKHLDYLREVVKVRDGERTDKTLTDLTVEFWREHLIDSIENLETEEGADFRDIPDSEEEITPLTVSYLTVVVKPATVAEKRKRSPIKSKSQTIITQAYFNGEVCEQKHILQKGDEWKKKYNRIQRSQYVEDKNNKDENGEAKLKFVPAYEDKLSLYDEMMIETHGFANDIIPARFKLTAIDGAFGSPIVDAKK